MATAVLSLDFHTSVRGDALREAAAQALRENRLDPKSLYVTPRQAHLWRAVSRAHSPIHGNAEFIRIYQEAFAKISQNLPGQKALLVGLGCGTGAKEQTLFSALHESGKQAIFSAIDVSADLVLQAAEALTGAGAEHRRSLVCDLGQVAFIQEWLDALEPDLPRLITFFGLVPNLPPSEVIRIFRAVLRPGDQLLVSVHLAPVFTDLPSAMSAVFPQYNNGETLAWLAEGIAQSGLETELSSTRMIIGERENIPAFLGFARWAKQPNRPPLEVFSSLRYTPPLFENLLSEAGLAYELLAITTCRQEAIWSIRSA